MKSKGGLLYRGFFLLLIFMSATVSYAQFYNGHQMDFGKNRVQYNDFYWSFYRFEQFDIYFNEFGRPLADYTAEVVSKKLYEIEDFFDYRLSKRLIFLVYNKQSDYKQSNIGLVSGMEETNVGGIKRVLENKVFLFYEGDHRKYDIQIAAAIAQVVINEMINSGDMRDRVSGSSDVSLPDWFVKGLIAYLSEPWDIDIDNRVKDGIMSGKFKNLNHVEKEDAILAGHSFWRYITEEYGEGIVPNILYLTRINKNLEKGFYYVMGEKIRTLSQKWVSYYKEKYTRIESETQSPASKPMVKRVNPKKVYLTTRISPDGNHIAYVTNQLGQYKIWMLDLQTGKTRKIYKKEPRVEQIIDYSYPVLAWYPNGRMLTFISEEKGGLVIHYYRLETRKTESINLLYFDKILDFDFSDDGSKMLFSAVKNGQTDLYIYDIASGTEEQLTNDIEDELHPRYIDHSERIIFSSNRISDTLRNDNIIMPETSPVYDLFILDYKKRPDVLLRLSEGRYWDKSFPLELSSSRYLYLNDQNGIINRYSATFDSTITFIDTITHYRYFTRSEPMTNYNRNILEQDFAPEAGIVSEVVYTDGKYVPGYMKLDEQSTGKGALPQTEYRALRDKAFSRNDSIKRIRQMLIEADRRRRDTMSRPVYSYFPSSNLIDINHYVFEQEKQNYYNQKLLGQYSGIDLDTTTISFPPIRIYETSFYQNYVANQVDFSFLAHSYQFFNGSGVFYNPGLNMLFKIGANDLFENYKIIAGFRFSGDFNSNEYLLSFENLKFRVDRQAVFHRQVYNAFDQETNTNQKVTSQQVYYSLKFPFTQVSAFRGTASLRTDRLVTLATDANNLYKKNLFLSWLSLKGEYIYDNTRKRGVNIYNGLRFKVFGEVYRQIERKKSDIFIVGGDFRHYLKIHRDLIWANRFAASTSFGHNKLIYYLGGVDNALNYMFNPQKAFNKNIPVDYTQNYVFQTVATDMRGFRQNIRNGNSFILLNSEIRWPVFRYLANHPLGSKFLNSFQIVGFGDVGTAWTGWNPYLGQNAYDKKVIRNGPITVTLNTNREPFVAGFGFGARALLFGYFVRADYAWGVENFEVQKPLFYLSFNMDF
ncbi:MAG: hypothetical protein GXO83_03050 [Chlorobi bacterium]|nr:hypothetical protein [Chlorobiota bacterium]